MSSWKQNFKNYFLSLKELIEKLKKSNHILAMWNQKKLEDILNKKKENEKLMSKKYLEEVQKEKIKASDSEKAFKIWKENKDNDLQNKIQKFKQHAKEKDESKKKNEESEKAFILWYVINSQYYY